jgi:ribonuclease G
LPWFRFLKKSKQQPAPPPAELEVLPPADEPEEEVEEETSEPSDPTAPKRRRRGSRGGRNRRKPAAGAEDGEGASEVSEPAARATGSTRAPRERGGRSERGGDRERGGDKGDREKGERGEKDERSQRRSRNAQSRRRQPPRRAPLPEAKRELLISVDVGEQRVAVIEDEKVAEVYLERPERRSIAGNIYLGTVDNVLPGMEAAFVEIGLEKNGFLYVDEIVVPELEGKRHGKKITDLIQRGQTILVQAVKDPMKTKGARLTTEISLPGRFLVYVPQGEGLGVSRRLEESERNRLKDILKALDITEGGVIVRTAAEGASAEDIERDFVFLQRLWKTIQAREKTSKAPELLYQEAELPLRIVRDLFASGFEAAHVDNDRAYKRIVGYLKKTSPDMIERVHRYKDKDPLFERFGVEKEIQSTLDRRVDLPSGGYLIFDYAEAFTVVDVNTGRFVGSRSKNSTQRLEDTIVKNNLEAVKEVVRQLRLRDIGGIIVIDFIDMANPKNRQAVEEALRQELERDRTKTYVVEISPLGLVEMTRQNVTDGPREVMTRKCPTCGGDGIVVSDATSAMKVERELRQLAANGARGVQAYKVAVHPRILPLLAGVGGERLRGLDEATKRRFFLVDADGHAHADHCTVLAEGKIEDVQPATSIAEGSEIEVKLVEVGLHDPSAAVGTVDGVEVIVAGAANQVGRKVKVQVGLALEGRVFATLVSGAAAGTPITFESEAEKPTRAPARRKAVDAAEGAEAVDDELEAEADVELEDEAGEEADGDAAEGQAAADGAAPKKRTRRGSRGGRRRKKKPVDGEATEGDEDEEDDGADEEPAEAATPDTAASADDAESPAAISDGGEDAEGEAPAPRPRRRRAPRIHVPDDGRGEDGETAAPAPAPVAAPVAASIDADAAVSGAEAEPDVDGVEADEPEAEGVEGESLQGVEGAPPKKRTRRGSRGGRNRKKKPAVAADGSEEADADGAAEVEGDEAGPAGLVADAAEAPADAAPADEQAATEEPAAAEEPVEEPEVDEPAAEEPLAEEEPAVEEPAAEEPAAEAAEQPVAGEDAPDDEAEEGPGDGGGTPAEPEPGPEGGSDPAEEEPAGDGYVPMSEWIQDFDRR